jgi:hypothetical protein
MKRESLVLLSLALWGGVPLRAGEQRVPSYTEEDLARVRPLRSETGVLSTPAFRAEPASRKGAGEAHGEAYWRREAERLRDQLRPLRREAESLRSRIGAARRIPTARFPSAAGRKEPPPRRAPDTAPLEERLRGLEQEIALREALLEERARRASALPGWLR